MNPLANRMASNKTIARWPIALATVLGVGALIVWAFACFWINFVVENAFVTYRQDDNLIFTAEGQALLQSYNGMPNRAVAVYRTLEGQVVDPESANFQIDAAANTQLPEPSRRRSSAIDWSQRVIGFGEARPTPVYWYLIHDGQQRGHAYFAGYDPHSKLPVGYLGLRGYRSDVPPTDEQLVIDRSQLQGITSYAGRWGSMGREPGNLGAEGKRALYIVSGESLLRVDLAQRLIHPVTLPDKVLSVGNIEEPKAVSDERKVIYEPRVVVRLPEELVVLNLKGETLRSVRIPREVRDAHLKLFGTTGPDSILVAARPPRGTPTEIMWIRPDGDVARQVQLPRSATGRDDCSNWLSTGALPSPPLEALMYFVLLPMQYVEQGEAADFHAALERSVSQTWAPFSTLCVLSALLAIYCYRRHRRYAPTGAWSWAAFVLVGGPPALVGYWLHRGWPAVEPCGACGAIVPRDRKGCLVCAAEFAPPPLKGIEVFA